MKILVTGAAGFIGSKTAMMLAERGDEVIGIDNVNEYYDVRLKYGRLSHLLGICHDTGEPYTDLPFGVPQQALSQFQILANGHRRPHGDGKPLQ